MCRPSWCISMRECNCTVRQPEDVGTFSPLKSLYIYINWFQQLVHKSTAPIRENSWCFVCLVNPWMFLSVFYANTPPTLNHCITQWLHAEGIVEPVIVIEMSKRLINLIVMLAVCVIFDQTCCWVDSGDQWIIDCKCATFSDCKAHGWREELCILGPHRCAKCLRRYEGINSVSAMHSRFGLKKKIKRYAYTKKW